MIINKTVLGQLDKVYAAAIMEINGTTNYLVATEGQGPCQAFDGTNRQESTIWDGPGGTMSIVPIPDKKNEFIATQEFLPTFQAQNSKIVHAKYEHGRWTVTPIMTVPYLHRFDIFVRDGKRLFIGSTLCEDKEYKEDWTKPGKVYVGELSADITKPFELKVILPGITKNHGFCKGQWKGKDAYLVSGSEGVFVLFPPEKYGDAAWQAERILDHEVSDIAVCDIDNDGCMELAAIEPFHGKRGVIYKFKDNQLTPVYEHEYEFGHVVWGGKLLNKPSFIIGGRKGNRELNCFQVAATGKIQFFTIDNTAGPSNIAVLDKANANKAVILAANREIGEIAVYELREA